MRSGEREKPVDCSYWGGPSRLTEWIPAMGASHPNPQPRTQSDEGSLNIFTLYYYHWGVKTVTCSLQHPVCIQVLGLLQIYFQACLVLFKFVIVGIWCFFPQDKSDQPAGRKSASGWDLRCLHSCPWPADVLLLLCFWASPGGAACFMSCKLTGNLGEHSQVARLISKWTYIWIETQSLQR